MICAWPMQVVRVHKQPVREAVSYRGLFTAGWFGVREKYCFRLEIYDRLRASEQAEECTPDATAAARQHILETPREHVPKR